MSDFPDRLKLPKCSGETSSKSKDNVRDGVQSQDQAKLAQDLQAAMEKVQLSEDAYEQEKASLQGLMDKCDRQENNICQLQCEREKISQKIMMKRKNQEIFQTKIAKASNICGSIHSNFQAVANSLNFVFADGKTCYERVEDMKQKSEQMLGSYNEMANVQVPKCVEDLKNAVKQQKDLNDKMRAEIQQKKDVIRDKQRYKKELLLQSLTKKKAQLCDLESKIASEQEEASCLRANFESLTQEKFQHKKSLIMQLKQWNQKNDTVKADSECVQADIAAASAELKSQQTDLSQAKEREEKLKDDFHKTKERLDSLAKALSVKKEEQEKVDLEVSAQINRSGILSKELEGIKEKLKETKIDTNMQVTKLKEEMFRESTVCAEKEEALLKSIDELREKDRNYKIEAEMTKMELVQIQKELDHERQNQSKTLESNNLLQNQLSSSDQEIEKLRRNSERQQEILSADRATTRSKERLLMQLNIKHEEVIRELEQQIGSFLEKENAALEELNVLKSEEKDILLKIEVLEKDDALSHTMLTEKHEKYISELEDMNLILDQKIGDISSNAKVLACEIQQKIGQVCHALDQKQNEFANLEVSIASQRGELEGLAKINQQLFMEKQEKQFATNVLSEKVNNHTEALDKKKEKVQELQSLIDAKAPKIKEADLQISELSLKFQNAKVEFSKLIAENESAKQAFVRDHVKFQKTCEYRQDEIKALQKQISVWNEKMEHIQGEITILKCEADTSEQNMKAAEMSLKEAESEVESLRAQVLMAEKEAKDAEYQAECAQKKVEELNQKIRIHKEARNKVRAGSTAEVFKVPLQGPSKRTTPQCIFPRMSEETLPHSILTSVSHSSSQEEKLKRTPSPSIKLSNKLCTPQEDNSLDESQSSASTIVLVPSLVDKIIEDPGMLRIITNQQMDRQAAKRKLRCTANIDAAQDAAIPSKRRVSENEISSSTPERESCNN